jgi:hypothetical protein
VRTADNALDALMSGKEAQWDQTHFLLPPILA